MPLPHRVQFTPSSVDTYTPRCVAAYNDEPALMTAFTGIPAGKPPPSIAVHVRPSSVDFQACVFVASGATEAT